MKHVDILLEYLVFLAFLLILVSCYNKLLFEVGYGLLVLVFLLIRFGEELFVLDLQLFIGLLVWVLETVLLYSGLEFCNGRLLLIYLLLLGLHLVHVLLYLLPLLLELDEAVLFHVVLAEVEVGWEGGGLGGVGVGDGADEQIFFLSKHYFIKQVVIIDIFKQSGSSPLLWFSLTTRNTVDWWMNITFLLTFLSWKRFQWNLLDWDLLSISTSSGNHGFFLSWYLGLRLLGNEI